jgi:proteasome lid subunit RPN8/RPN11
MDRVPVFLEIDAANMPHPCKILLRPAARRYPEAVCNLIQQNMAIYISTKTKNPSERNHQLKIAYPAKNVIMFAPLLDDKAPGAKKDIF